MPVANAFPAKRFFVDMLVRDIELKDAVLDLLDNCVDGAMRRNTHTPPLDAQRPYEGYWAKIEFDGERFSIRDNCGGIPIDVAELSAFRLGRVDVNQDPDLPTVGFYGIGMKRAIFKLGTHCVVTSYDGEDAFRVEITPAWMASDDNWRLDIENIEQRVNLERGTRIVVTQLRDVVGRALATEEFANDFRRDAETYYGYIIEKGFHVEINGTPVVPKKIRLLIDRTPAADGTALAPYVYRREGAPDGVRVVLSVGLYRPMPTEDDEEQELTGRASSEDAGWTIICNDRVVLHADKTRATGWGDAGVPNYHTQFASIAGVVIFESNDPDLLPITTTKRGIDGNSDLYLQVKDFMREGLKVFTSFTNSWKKRPQARLSLQEEADSALPEVVVNDQTLRFAAVRKPIGGERSTPVLPTPAAVHTDAWIRFSRPLADIQLVSSVLFGHRDGSPSEVGATCFDQSLEVATERQAEGANE